MTLTARPKKPKYYKKVSGNHHRRSTHYLKAYWPYLPMLSILGLGLAINVLWSAPKTAVLGQSSNFSAEALLNDTNADRTKDNEKSLTLNGELAAAAQAKANDMAARDYWSHDTPDGKTPWSFIAASGYQYQAAGENLAYGFNGAGDTVSAWMNSPEHRANILDAGYQNVGFGVANSPNYNGSGPETVVVAMYAEPASVTAASASVPAQSPRQTAPARLASVAEPPAQNVSRVQLLTAGNAPWSLFAASAIAAVALLTFILRHGLLWRKVLVESEEFVIKHPFLDLMVVGLSTAGFVLTRTGGIIR